MVARLQDDPHDPRPLEAAPPGSSRINRPSDPGLYGPGSEAWRLDREAMQYTCAYFPEAGITKADLIEYYERIAPFMLPVCRSVEIVSG